jgi:hypothetical protein
MKTDTNTLIKQLEAIASFQYSSAASLREIDPQKVSAEAAGRLMELIRELETVYAEKPNSELYLEKRVAELERYKGQLEVTEAQLRKALDLKSHDFACLQSELAAEREKGKSRDEFISTQAKAALEAVPPTTALTYIDPVQYLIAYIRLLKSEQNK